MLLIRYSEFLTELFLYHFEFRGKCFSLFGLFRILAILEYHSQTENIIIFVYHL